MISGPYKIEWRPLAREDLKAIVRFIGQDSPARARTFGEIFGRASFVAAELGHQAGAIGAAAVAMHNVR